MTEQPETIGRRVATHVAVLGACLAIALLHLRPLGGALTTALARGNREDTLLHGWIMNWTARALASEPLRVFDSNSFFPFPRSLAYTEHFIPEALPVAPLTWLTDNPVLIYNVAFLLSFVLSGWGTFLLVRRLTGSTAAGFVAGAFACWFPAKRWALAHPNTLALQWLPFAMLAAHRMLERPAARRVVVLAVAAALAALSSAYYTVYVPVLLCFGLPLLWWAEGWPLTRQRALALISAGALTGLLMAPVLWQYLSTYGPEKVHYEYRYAPGGGADVGDYLLLDSWLWPVNAPPMTGRLTAPLFPGLVALGLVAAGMGLAVPRCRDRRLGLAGTAVAAIGLGIVVAALARHHRAWLAGAEAPVEWLWPGLLVLASGSAVALHATGEGAPSRLSATIAGLPRVPFAYLLLALLAAFISLGQQLQFFGFLGPRLPLSWLNEAVPSLAMLRAPFRAGYLAMALLAIPVGFGAARVARAAVLPRAGVWTAALLTLAMSLEFLGPALPPTPPPAPRQVDRWLASQPGDFGVVELPMPDRMWQTARGQWRSVYHWKRRVTGHNGFLPPETLRLHSMASPVLRDDFLEYLVEFFPVRYVLIDLAELSQERRDWLLRERLPELDHRLELITRLDDTLVLRVLNGGELGTLRRQYPDRMLAPVLRVEMDRPVPARLSGDRIAGSIDGDDEALLTSVLREGQRFAEMAVSPDLVVGPLFWVRLRLRSEHGTLAIRAVCFRATSGERCD